MMNRNPNKALAWWLATGVLAYLAVPWYAIQDTAWYSVLAQVWSGAETANGLVQAWANGRSWLLIGLLGLAIAAVGLGLMPTSA